MEASGRAISRVVALLAMVTIVAAAPAAWAFDDVGEDAFYADAVAWGVDVEIVNGTSPTTFEPNRAVTNAETATMLWRLAGAPNGIDHPYVDVPPGAYFEEAAQWTRWYGLLDRVGVEFGPGRAITRAEAAEVLYIHAGFPLYALPHPFVDVPPGHPNELAIRALYHSGLTKGTSPTTFSPDRTLTRGELLTLLWRWMPIDPAVNPHQPWPQNLLGVVVMPDDSASINLSGSGVQVPGPVPKGLDVTIDGAILTVRDTDGTERVERFRVAIESCPGGSDDCPADRTSYTPAELTVQVRR